MDTQPHVDLSARAELQTRIIRAQVEATLMTMIESGTVQNAADLSQYLVSLATLGAYNLAVTNAGGDGDADTVLVYQGETLKNWGELLTLLGNNVILASSKPASALTN